MSVALPVDVLAAPPAGARTRARDYIALTKPRIIILLEVTTLAAMVMAARGWPRTDVVIATLIGGALAAGAANAINCWFDRDIDAAMKRTRLRPIPSGRIDSAHALGFGAALAVAAFTILAVFTNVLAAVLALSALLFYVLVYTMYLKRSSTQNIVIGGAAGAVPPLVGWAAVTGRLELDALLLFAIVFYWTPPHFWSLALLIRNDYERAHVPMLPVVVGEAATRVQIVLWTAILVVVTALPLLAGGFGSVYAIGAAALDGAFLGEAALMAARPSAGAARRLFHHSLLYLALLFAVMAADRVIMSR